ncbi:hypothetical protein AJ80_09700 [Polytolypa hystricis UAMH7299]|uniref:Protein kinase domain-containing protein n=1 Tax=Polytolypa hystricis (strain UAMH7299) TaxID=1447883 RepID=A0A2B7WLL4_POLH7|nr:hypothetical protein AJ80_09700 [Polytolypa hystricis UAMH7299]
MECSDWMSVELIAMCNAVLTLPPTTPWAELQHWIKAINAISIYSGIQEGPLCCQCFHKTQPTPVPPTPAEPEGTCTLSWNKCISAVVREVCTKKRPKICFLCLQNSKLLPADQVYSFKTPGDLTKHYQRQHLEKFQPMGCGICRVRLETLTDLLIHAECAHGTVTCAPKYRMPAQSATHASTCVATETRGVFERHVCLVRVSLSPNFSKSIHAHMTIRSQQKMATPETDSGAGDGDGIVIQETFTGKRDDCEIRLSYNLTCFIVLLKRSSSVLDTSIEGNLLLELDQSEDSPDEILFHRCLEKIHDIAISTCKDVMSQLAPQHREHRPETLEDRQHPTTFTLQLVTLEGRLQAIQLHKPRLTKYPHFPPGLDLARFQNRNIREIHASELEIVKDLHFQKVVKVSCGLKTYVFKTGEPPELEREVQILQAVSEKRPPHSVNIPHLVGLVVSDNMVIGFLEQEIPGGEKLTWKRLTGVSNDTIQAWVCQIRESIDFLHGLGVCWGDAKADNVLVDCYGNAWIIDFGGGYTDGWVEESAKETMAGDLQGLQQIKKCLGIS